MLERIAGAMIIQALRDMKEGDQEAADWLRTTGVRWLGMLDIDINPAELYVACRKRWVYSRKYGER